MTRPLPLSASLLAPIVLAACSGRPVVTESPFDGSGAFETPGIIAALYAGPDASGAVADELGVDAEFDVLLLALDSEVFGGELALALGGDGAEAAFEGLVDDGWLSPVEGRDDAYRPISPFEHGLGMPQRFPFPGVRPTTLSGELRRVDADGRLLLLPTIDLRGELLAMSDAARGPLGRDTVGVALDGAACAAWVGRTVVPVLEGAQTMLGAAVAGGDGGDELERALFGLRVSLAMLEHLDGVVARLDTEGGAVRGGRLALTPRRESPLAALFGAFREIEGEWPVLDESAGRLMVAGDAVAFCDALERLAEEALIDRSLEFVETFDAEMKRLREVGLTGVAVGEEGEFALRCVGALRPEDLLELEAALGVEPRVEGAWLVHSNRPLGVEAIAVDPPSSLWARFDLRGEAQEVALRWDGAALAGDWATR